MMVKQADNLKSARLKLLDLKKGNVSRSSLVVLMAFFTVACDPPTDIFNLETGFQFSGNSGTVLVQKLTSTTSVCYTTDGSTPVWSGGTCDGGSTQRIQGPVTAGEILLSCGEDTGPSVLRKVQITYDWEDTIDNVASADYFLNCGDDTGGGGDTPVITLSKSNYEQGESVQVNFQNSTDDTDWVGIYKAGTIANSCTQSDAYVAWKYAEGVSGSLRFSGLDIGNYDVQLFAENGYCHLGSALSFNMAAGSGGGGGGTTDGVKIAFIGDTGTGSNFQNVLNLIKQEGAELTIVAGDTSYSSSKDDNWDSMVQSTLGSSDPAIVAAGNHDYDDSNFSDVRSFGEARLNRATNVSCSGTYAEKMTCQYKNVHIVLSAIGASGSRSSHESYIANSLNDAPEGSWRICAWHKNQRDMQVGGKSDEVGWTAYETCRQQGAIISTGHEHSYSRTHLLSDMSEKTIASTASTFTVTEGRTFAFVSGLGGIGIRDQERGGDWWSKIYTSTQGARYGAMFGTFYEDRADFYFKNIDGQVIDQFTVMKGY